MSAATPTAAELSERFINEGDLSYEERAALFQELRRAVAAEAGADAYGTRVLPVQGGAR